MNNSIDPNSQNYLKNQTQSNNDNWIRYNKSPHSLISSSFELKKSWIQKEYFKTFQNLFIFSLLIWAEVKGSLFSHLFGFSASPGLLADRRGTKELSMVQRWFYSSTGGESSSLLGWITFYSWLYTRNFVKYRKNELRGSIKSSISYFSSLPQFESISAKIFILATFCAAFQAYNLSQTTSPILYIRKNKAAVYQELFPARQEFKKSQCSLRSYGALGAQDSLVQKGFSYLKGSEGTSVRVPVGCEASQSLLPEGTANDRRMLSDVNLHKANHFSDSLAKHLLSSMVSLKVPSFLNDFDFSRYFSQDYKTDLSRFIKLSDGKIFISTKTFKPIYDQLSKPTQNIYQSITIFGKIDLKAKDFLLQKYNLFTKNIGIGDLTKDPSGKIGSSHLFVINTPLFPHLLADYSFENSKTFSLSLSPSSSDLHINQDPIYSFVNFDWLPVGQKRLNLGLTTYQNQLKKIGSSPSLERTDHSSVVEEQERNKNGVLLSATKSTVSSGLFWLSEIYPQQDINFLIYSCSIFTRSFIPLFSIYILSIIFELLNASSDEIDSGVNSFVPSSVKIVGALVNKKRLSNILGIEALLPDLKELFYDLNSIWASAPLSALPGGTLPYGHPKGSNKPKGYLFIGPPGTGKTKLAEAIAGEGNVTFIATSAAACLTSSSALNIRTLFYQARQLAPCILFIDEIDSFGLSRQDLFLAPGTRVIDEKLQEQNSGPGSVQKLQALTEFLVQMDGIESNEKIFVIGATNNRNLDPALIRPGRFDRSISFGLPSPHLRIDILKLYGKKKGLDPSICWPDLIPLTTNLGGAYLEAIMNESLLKVMNESRPYHTFETIKHGIKRITSVSVANSLQITTLAKIQNPFYRIQPAFSEMSKGLINLSFGHQLTQLGISTNIDLIPVSALAVSDITVQELLERTYFKLLPLSTHLNYISYLLASSLSDYFLISSIKVFKNRLFRWITPGNLTENLQAKTIADLITADWPILNSGLKSFFLDSKLTNLNKRRLSSSLKSTDSFLDFIEFKDKTTFVSWATFPMFIFNNILHDWSENPSLKYDLKAKCDLYYHQNYNFEIRSESLKAKEDVVLSIVTQSQKTAFQNLSQYEFFYPYLVTLLLFREKLLGMELDFIVKKTLYDFYSRLDSFFAITFLLNDFSQQKSHE